MKRSFAILVLNAHKTIVQNTKPNYAPLLELGAKHHLDLLTDQDLNVNGHAESEALDRLDTNAIVLIGGNPSEALLRAALDDIFRYNLDAMIVVDALENRDQLHKLFLEFNRDSIQMVKLKEAEAMFDKPRLMMYAYPKADTTATTFVVLDWYTDNPLVLTIMRLHNPYQGHECAPGGYLDVMLETVLGCAAREVEEETHLKDAKVEYIDTRSEVDRDERGHVIDHGFAWFVPKRLRNRVAKAVKAGDDAAPGSAHFTPVKELRKRTLGFDHDALFKATVKRMRERRRDYDKRSRAQRFPKKGRVRAA